MSRYEKTKEGPNGWSQWIHPLQQKRGRVYRLACCDCGLVHDMQFRVAHEGKRHRILFRARRNNRATAAVRRYRKERT